jgi:tetratricopeptide (TPR) repeat protein
MVVFHYRHRANCYNERLVVANNPDLLLEMTDGFSVFSTVTYGYIPYHWYRGVAYNKLGDRDRATEAFEEAFKYAPYNIHVIKSLAQNLIDAGRDGEAIIYYKKHLEI